MNAQFAFRMLVHDGYAALCPSSALEILFAADVLRPLCIEWSAFEILPPF